MPYATPAQMTLRYDVRRLGQLCTDGTQPLVPAQLTANTILLEALEDAAGLINSALLRGGRYDAADLAALTGSDAKLLVRVTCDLAYGLLVQRRGYTSTELESLAPAYTGALALLDRLANGELVFNIPSAIAAGKPVRVVIDKNLQLISSSRRLYGDTTVNPNNPGNPTDFE